MLHALRHALIDAGLEYLRRVLRTHGDAGVQGAARAVAVVPRSGGGSGLLSGGGGARGGLTAREGAAVGSHLDVGEGDGGVWISALHILRVPGVSWTWASADPGLGGVSVGGIVTVQPQHVHRVVIPHGHDQHVASV